MPRVRLADRAYEEKLFRWQKANPFPRVSRGNFAEVRRGEKFELPASCEKSRDERVSFVLFGRNNELRRSTSGGKIIPGRDSQSSCYIVAVDQRRATIGACTRGCLMFRSIWLEQLFISTSDLLSVPTLYCNALSPLGSPFSVRAFAFPSSLTPSPPRDSRSAGGTKEKIEKTKGGRRGGRDLMRRKDVRYTSRRKGGRNERLAGKEAEREKELEEDVATARMQNAR